MKRFHLISLFFIVSAVVLSITSVVGPSVPWAKSKIYYSCQSDLDCQGYQCDNTSHICITPNNLKIYYLRTLGLLEYNDCLGVSSVYTSDVPTSCRDGGTLILIIMAVGVVIIAAGVGVIFYRAKSGKGRFFAILFPMTAAFTFTFGFVYWAVGCNLELNRVLPHYNVAVGFWLAFISFLLASFVTIVQLKLAPSEELGNPTATHAPVQLDPRVSVETKDSGRESEDAEDPSGASSAPTGLPMYAPTEIGKFAHLLSLLLLLVVVVCASISLTNQSVPWTKYDVPYEEAFGRNSDDPDLHVIIRAGLTTYDSCTGKTLKYENPTCKKNGKISLILMCLGLIVATSSALFVYLRGRGIGKYSSVFALFTCFVSFGLTAGAWVYWGGSTGCPHALNATEGGNPFSLEVGWTLSVTAWSFLLSALVIQIIACFSRSSPQEDMHSERRGYVTLFDAEVPYL